jgi:hypothetical protein
MELSSPYGSRGGKVLMGEVRRVQQVWRIAWRDTSTITAMIDRLISRRIETTILVTGLKEASILDS